MQVLGLLCMYILWCFSSTYLSSTFHFYSDWLWTYCVAYVQIFRPALFLLCTFIIHETFWLKRENIFSHPFHILILRPYFIRSRFLNFFPTLLKSSIVYVWFQMVRHFYHIIWNLRIGWSLPRTTDTQRELFFKNSKLLGLGRQIGLKFFEAFGVFSAKLLALFWHCVSLVHGKM